MPRLTQEEADKIAKKIAGPSANAAVYGGESGDYPLYLVTFFVSRPEVVESLDGFEEALEKLENVYPARTSARASLSLRANDLREKYLNE